MAAGSTNSFGSGNSDCWVIKLNAAAKIEWQKAYGGPNAEWGYSIQQTSDDGFVLAGCTASFGAGGWDAWVIKLDLNGNVSWQKAYGGPKDEIIESVLQTFDGGFILAGRSDSFSGSTFEMWLVKLNPAGDVEWQQGYSGGSAGYGLSVAQTSDGGFMVGAALNYNSLVKLTHSGDVRWAAAIIGSAESIWQMPDETFIVSGVTVRNGAPDLYIAKVDHSGFVTWQWKYGGGQVDRAHAAAPTRDGGYIVAGETYSFGGGNKDAWILKLDGSGRTVWQRTFGGAKDDELQSIQQALDGSFIAAGTTASFGIGTESFLS